MKSNQLQVALLALCFVPAASAMEQKICGDQLILSGGVVSDDVYRVKSLLKENKAITTVVLRNSHGGDADTGYTLGAYFRDHNIATYVSGYCQSSCSRLFLGGAGRYFTDDYGPPQTYVGFHSNYNKSGGIVPGAQYRLTAYVKKYSDGKADPALVERWVNISNHQGFAYFYYPQAFHREDGVSVLLCQGSEPLNAKWKTCEKIPDHDALTMGVITSMDVKHSCDTAELIKTPPKVESSPAL